MRSQNPLSFFRCKRSQYFAFVLIFYLFAGTLVAQAESTYLYVTSPNTNQIATVDVTQSPMAIITYTNVAGSPYGIAADPTERYLYVVCQSDNTLKRLDTSNMSSTPVIIPLSEDDKLAYNVLISPDGRYAFVLKLNGTNMLSSVDVFNIENLNNPIFVYNTGDLVGASLAMSITQDSQLLYIGTAGGNAYGLSIPDFQLSSPFPGGPGISTSGINSAKGVVLFLSVASMTALGVYYTLYEIPPTSGGAANVGSDQDGIPTGVSVLSNGEKAYASIAKSDSMIPSYQNGVLEIDFGTDPFNLISYPFFLNFSDYGMPSPIMKGPASICINREETALYLPALYDNRLAKVTLPLNTAHVEYLTLDSPYQGVFAASSISQYPASPQSVKGRQLINQFLFEHELFNRITWLPSPSPDITSYLVKKNGELVQTIGPQGPFRYEEHNLAPGLTLTYSITAVNQNNLESVPAFVTIPGTQ